MRWNFNHYSWTKSHCNYIFKCGKEKWNEKCEQCEVRAVRCRCREEDLHSPQFPPGRPHGGSTSPQQRPSLHRPSDHRREDLLQHWNLHRGLIIIVDSLKSLKRVLFSQSTEELTVMVCGFVMFSDVWSCVTHVVSLPVSCTLMPLMWLCGHCKALWVIFYVLCSTDKLALSLWLSWLVSPVCFPPSAVRTLCFNGFYCLYFLSYWIASACCFAFSYLHHLAPFCKLTLIKLLTGSSESKSAVEEQLQSEWFAACFCPESPKPNEVSTNVMEVWLSMFKCINNTAVYI